MKENIEIFSEIFSELLKPHKISKTEPDSLTFSNIKAKIKNDIDNLSDKEWEEKYGFRLARSLVKGSKNVSRLTFHIIIEKFIELDDKITWNTLADYKRLSTEEFEKKYNVKLDEPSREISKILTRHHLGLASVILKPKN